MTRTYVARPRPATAVEFDQSHKRRQISHDINHELATIRLLTALLIDAPDIGSESRRRAALILGETRWLEQLHRAYEAAVDADGPTQEMFLAVRMDEIAAEVVDAMRHASPAEIRLSAVPVTAYVDRLLLWRAVRNLIDNAIRASGSDGLVQVTVSRDDECGILHVDDNGPGFVGSGRRRGALGLKIVHDFVAGAGGVVQIGRGTLGGCRVSLRIPLAIAAVDDPLGANPGTVEPQ